MMARKTVWIAAAFALVVLSGCQTWQPIEPERRALAGGHTIQPTRLWSGIRVNDTYHLTINGPGLERVVLSPDIKDGKPLFDMFVNAAQEGPVQSVPKLAKGSSIIEMIEVLENTLEASGMKKIEKTDIAREPINGRTVTVVSMTMENEAGLELLSKAYLVNDDRGASAFLYYGTKLYHYRQYEQDVDAMIRSILWSEKTPATAARSITRAWFNG